MYLLQTSSVWGVWKAGNYLKVKWNITNMRKQGLFKNRALKDMFNLNFRFRQEARSSLGRVPLAQMNCNCSRKRYLSLEQLVRTTRRQYGGALKVAIPYVFFVNFVFAVCISSSVHHYINWWTLLFQICIIDQWKYTVIMIYM